MSRGTAIRAARRAAAAAAAAEEAAAEEAAAAEEEEGGCCWLDRKLLALTLIGLLPPSIYLYLSFSDKIRRQQTEWATTG